MPQLDDVYGKAKARTILGNCHTKLCYPPRDMETAEHVAKVFGTELRYARSDSSSSPSTSDSHAYHGRQTSITYAERVAPALAPTELDALPACAVIVLAQADRQYRVLAERLNPSRSSGACLLHRRSVGAGNHANRCRSPQMHAHRPVQKKV